jgi:hypothetical protein
MRSVVALLCGMLLGAVSLAHAASMPLAWDASSNPKGFVVLRCTIPASGTMCTPDTDLGPPIDGIYRSFVDTTASGNQCWAVKSVDASGNRSAPGTAVDGKTPYVCKQQTPAGTVLPPAGPITLQPAGSALRVLWTPPTFDATTVPLSALTGYEVWRRAEPQTPTTGWVRLVAVGPTVTTWDDPSPFVGGNCYQIRATYGTLGFKEGGTTCTTFTPPPLQAPTNLREVIPPPPKAGQTR